MKLNEINVPKDLENLTDWKDKAKLWIRTYTNFAINDKLSFNEEDKTINVHGDIKIEYKSFRRLPDYIKFNDVYGNFWVNNCAFKTLEGFPKKIEGDFRIINCKVESLDGSPKLVGGNYDCSNNRLKDLYGAPNIVSGHFACENNDLITLAGCPSIIHGNLQCDNNEFTSFEEFNRTIDVRGDVFLSDCTDLKDLRGIEKVFEKATGFGLDHSRIEYGGIGILFVANVKDILFEPYEACEIIKKYLGKPNQIYECQAELIEKGFEGIAEL